MGKNTKLSYDELLNIVKGLKKKRKKNKKIKKTRRNDIKYNQVRDTGMRDYVISTKKKEDEQQGNKDNKYYNRQNEQTTRPSVFPSGTGPSVLSRELDTIRGEINKQTNKLIGDGKGNISDGKKENPLLSDSIEKMKSNLSNIENKLLGEYDKKSNKLLDDQKKLLLEERKNINKLLDDNQKIILKNKNDSQSLFPTPAHVKFYQMGVDLIDGKRQFASNNDGSVTIFPTNYVNDGSGDFSRTTFEPEPKEKQQQNTLLDNTWTFLKNLRITNDQPRTISYMPTGDNIDVPLREFNIDPTQEQVENNDIVTDNIETIETVEIPDTDDVIDDTDDDTNDIETINEIKKFMDDENMSYEGLTTKQELIDAIDLESARREKIKKDKIIRPISPLPVTEENKESFRAEDPTIIQPKIEENEESFKIPEEIKESNKKDTNIKIKEGIDNILQKDKKKPIVVIRKPTEPKKREDVIVEDVSDSEELQEYKVNVGGVFVNIFDVNDDTLKYKAREYDIPYTGKTSRDTLIKNIVFHELNEKNVKDIQNMAVKYDIELKDKKKKRDYVDELLIALGL